ncbi:hypothetical protein [Phenylobacterium sp.]|jgi:hypothetical protein|uniref:hypothetical protein n=1 Tax=Phenylobacterium sp. TaxID=1871053 RepID=UPI0037843BE1
MARLAAVMMAALLAASPAAAATLSLTGKPRAGQVLREHSERPAIQSEARSTTAALVVQSVRLDENGSADFLLALQNSGSETIRLNAGDLVVQAGDKLVRVYSVEELKAAARDMKLLAQSHISAMAQPGVLGGAAARAAYVALPDGRYLEDPNPPKGSKAQVLAEANRRLAAAEAASTRAETAGFRRVVLAPGAGGWTGLTLAALPKAATTLQISVTLGADIHRFELAIDR